MPATRYPRMERPKNRTNGPNERAPPDGRATNPTTSFLTAATLIYAIGAGITAAAGTRLALQLILDNGFKLFSFQKPNMKCWAVLFIVTTSLY